MSYLANVEQSLLKPSGLDLSALESCLGKLYTSQLDYADIYLQSARNEAWILEDGIIRDGSFNHELGAGIRGVVGEKTAFAYTDELSLPSLMQAAQTARGIAAAGSEQQIGVRREVANPGFYETTDPLAQFATDQKIALLKQVDEAARQADSRITQVIASISGVYEEVLVMASDGALAADIRPLVRLNCSVVMEKGDRRERGSAGMGGRLGYEYFLELNEDGVTHAIALAHEAVRQAAVNMEAIDAPAGSMPVVLGAGWPGVLLHEAVGHGLEGDFNRKGSSVYSGQIGEKVTSELCTIVDDATMPNRRGSLAIDDEGTPGEYTVLIEKGMLKGYMQDKLNARLSGASVTGNGRRESYASLPMPRMTNTYMLPGEHHPEDIIASVEKGLYAPNFGGGQVDITSGKFVFSTSEAYLIENGKITTPVKGATLIGSGAESMRQVSMVGNDLALDKGVGVCGKDGQSVPVGVGQPTIKLDSITVGGTQ